jgi:hypothetical protein
MSQQLSLIALEPCKHCGGNAIKCSDIERSMFGSYRTHFYQCDRCTLETHRLNGCEDRAIECWNKGVPQLISFPAAPMSSDYHEGTFSETWNFLTKYCKAKMPTTQTAGPTK